MHQANYSYAMCQTNGNSRRILFDRNSYATKARISVRDCSSMIKEFLCLRVTSPNAIEENLGGLTIAEERF